MTPVIDRMQNIGYNMPDIERQASFALRIINRDSSLLECDKNSILAAVLDCATVGLTLNPAEKFGYLIARWNGRRKVKECVFEPSYKGLAYLAIKDTNAKLINTQLVYENDDFVIDLSSNEKPVQKHTFHPLKRGEVIGVYVLTTMQDGTQIVEFMDIEQVHEIRSRSESWKAYEAGKLKTCPWVTDEGEMIRKTCIKRAVKYLTRDDDETDLNKAIDLDNRQYPAEWWQKDKIDQLLPTAAINDEHREQIYKMMDGYSYQQAFDMIDYLKDNQIEKSPVDRMGSKDLDGVIANAVNRPNT